MYILFFNRGFFLVTGAICKGRSHPPSEEMEQFSSDCYTSFEQGVLFSIDIGFCVREWRLYMFPKRYALFIKIRDTYNCWVRNGWISKEIRETSWYQKIRKVVYYELSAAMNVGEPCPLQEHKKELDAFLEKVQKLKVKVSPVS